MTPPVKRKPCLGRNIEDSDADLYAEYHGDDSSVLTDSSNNIGPRQRSSSGRKDTEAARKLFIAQPDLSSTINTNFSILSNSDQLSLTPSPQPENRGFDFTGQFGNVYANHQRFLEESGEAVSNRGDGDIRDEWRSRSWSVGNYMYNICR